MHLSAPIKAEMTLCLMPVNLDFVFPWILRTLSFGNQSIGILLGRKQIYYWLA